MIGRKAQARNGRNQSRSRRVVPALEGLESRELLYATTGGMFSMPQRITYSFVPDGTNIGGTPSSLYRTMSANGLSTSTWQNAVRDAMGVWQAVAGINLVEVSDNGAPYSVSGDQQGDPRFGDIRIGGVSLGSDKVAAAFLPPAYNGGTLAGDIVLNTDQPWGGSNGYDVETAAIHEVGHALGMDHTSVSQAEMYAYYTSTKGSISSDDTAGIRSIYGARQPDVFDAYHTNDSYYYADNVSGWLDGNQQLTLTNLDISANTDYDWFYVAAPSGTSGRLTVTMQSEGLSSLDPRVYVYNSSLRLVGYAMAPGSYGSTISVTIPSVQAGQGFFIRTMAATAGPAGTGSYALQLNFGSSPQSPISPPNTTVAQQPDWNGSASAGLTPSTGGASSTSHSSGGLLGGLLNLVGSVVKDLTSLITTITIGNLSGWGDNLEVAPGVHQHGHQANLPTLSQSTGGNFFSFLPDQGIGSSHGHQGPEFGGRFGSHAFFPRGPLWHAWRLHHQSNDAQSTPPSDDGQSLPPPS